MWIDRHTNHYHEVLFHSPPYNISMVFLYIPVVRHWMSFGNNPHSFFLSLFLISNSFSFSLFFLRIPLSHCLSINHCLLLCLSLSLFPTLSPWSSLSSFNYLSIPLSSLVALLCDIINTNFFMGEIKCNADFQKFITLYFLKNEKLASNQT